MYSQSIKKKKKKDVKRQNKLILKHHSGCDPLGTAFV